MTGDIELEFILEIMVVMLVATAVPIILATPLFIFVPETHMFLHVISCIAIDISGWLHSIYILICSALSQMIIHLTRYIYTRVTREPQVCHDVKDCRNPGHKNNRQGSIAEDIATTPEDDSGPNIKNEYCAVSCFGEDEQLSDFGRGETVHLDSHPISDSGELDSDEPERKPVLDPDGKPALNHDGDKFDGNSSKADSSLGKTLEPDLDKVSDSNEPNPTAPMLETCSAVELPVEADSGLGNSITSNPDQQLDSNGLDKDQQLIKQVNEQSRVNHDEIENLAKESEQVGKEEVFDLNTKSEVIPSEQMENLAQLDFSRSEQKKDDFDFVVDENGGILTLPFFRGRVTFVFPRGAVAKRTRLRIAAGKKKPDEDDMLSLTMPSLHIFQFSNDLSQKFIQPVKFQIPIVIETKLLVDCDINEMKLHITQSSNHFNLNWETVDGAELRKIADRISMKIGSFAGLRVVTKRKYMELLYCVYLKRPTGIKVPNQHFVTAQICSTGSWIRNEAGRAFESCVNDVIIGRQLILVRTPCNLTGRVFVTSMKTCPESHRLKINSDRINVLREMSFEIEKPEGRVIEPDETFDMNFELQCGCVTLCKVTQKFYWNTAPVRTRHSSVVSIGSVNNLTIDVNGADATGIVVDSASQRSKSSYPLRDHVFHGILDASSAPLFNHSSNDDSNSEDNFVSEAMDGNNRFNIDNLHIKMCSPLLMTTPVHQSTPNQTISTNMQASYAASTSRAEPKILQPNFISEMNFPIDE